jgi:hypothetical protein
MRIELSTFDARGAAVNGSFVDLSPEQINAIVARAHQVTLLHREGLPLAGALAELDEAFTSASVLQVELTPRASSEPAAVDSLVQAAAAVIKSADVDGCSNDMIVVSKASLDGLGSAAREIGKNRLATEWKWIRTGPAGRSSVLEDGIRMKGAEEVLERMKRASSMGGDLSVQQAMRDHPMEFCQAFAELVAIDVEQTRARSAMGTVVVHIDADGDTTILGLTAPVGMSELAVQESLRWAVQSSGANFTMLHNALAKLGFEQIESVEMKEPADDSSEELGDSPGSAPG